MKKDKTFARLLIATFTTFNRCRDDLPIRGDALQPIAVAVIAPVVQFRPSIKPINAIDPPQVTALAGVHRVQAVVGVISAVHPRKATPGVRQLRIKEGAKAGQHLRVAVVEQFPGASPHKEALRDGAQAQRDDISHHERSFLQQRQCDRQRAVDGGQQAFSVGGDGEGADKVEDLPFAESDRSVAVEGDGRLRPAGLVGEGAVLGDNWFGSDPLHVGGI